MSLLHPLCVLALFASPLLSAYEQPANTDRARRPSSLGQAEGITLVSDDFTGSGSLLRGVPEEDIDGGGWKTTDAAIQPRRDGGRLVSGGADGVAAIMLPPLSPHGEVTITVTLSLRGDHGMMLGFTDAVHHPKEGGSGP